MVSTRVKALLGGCVPCGNRYSSRAMKFLPMLLMAASVFAVSCERHDFDGEHGTRQINEPHGAHAAGHEAGGEHAAEPAPH